MTTKWTPEMDAELGKLYDTEVARRWGISQPAVTIHRNQLGISPHTPFGGINWTPEMDALLGTIPDAEVAAEFGICGVSAGKRRWELGIPAFLPRIEWTKEKEALLGTMFDKEVAKQLGMTLPSVAYHRRGLGIPSWREQNRILPKGLPAWTAEAQRILGARKRQRKAELPDSLTYEQWKFACKWFDNRCAYCEEKCFLTEDHLVPLSRGGPRTVLNIIPACASCNNQKHAKRAHLWIYEKFGIEEGKEIVERIVAYLTEVQRGTRSDG